MCHVFVSAQHAHQDVTWTMNLFLPFLSLFFFQSTWRIAIAWYLWTRTRIKGVLFISRKFDDDRSAAKMEGESGPTGRAIFVRRKAKQKDDGKHTVYMGTLYLYWSLYWIQSTCTCSHRSLPILPSTTTKEIWLKRLRVVRWFPALLKSIRLITSVGSSLQKTSD